MAKSALAKANLEIGSLKRKPGRLPAGAQLLHGHTYWCIIGDANAIYLLKEDNNLNPVCRSPFTKHEYIFTSAAHSFPPSKSVDLQEGMTENFHCGLLHSVVYYHHFAHQIHFAHHYRAQVSDCKFEFLCCVESGSRNFAPAALDGMSRKERGMMKQPLDWMYKWAWW